VTAIYDVLFEVTGNRALGEDLYLLRLTPVSEADCWRVRSGKPGQFVMLDLAGEQFQFRRPFSFLDVHDDGSAEIFYKVVGRGTAEMASWREGHRVKCLVPLGQGFEDVPDNRDQVLLVAGGIGLAPLYYLAAYGFRYGAEGVPTCVYGVRNQQSFGVLDEVKSLFPHAYLEVATDDGSYGFHGNVTQLMRGWAPERLQSFSHAYVCGPNPMMKAVAETLTELHPAMKVYVSLENAMPCGTGACYGCVVATAPSGEPKRACVEGPVFLAQHLQWGERGPLATFSGSGPGGATCHGGSGKQQQEGTSCHA